MRFVLLGPPGVGKGTQAQRLANRYGVCHVSTGDMFRDAVARGAEVGRRAKRFMDSGELVPDDVVTAILKERIALEDCRRGFVLDGFPRTQPQARALDGILKERGEALDAVVCYVVPEEVAVERLSGRRMCERCGANYHIKFNPPKTPGVCDKCGGRLCTRSDDKPDTIRERLRIYVRSTETLIEYYRKRGLLIEASATASPEEVESATEEALQSLWRSRRPA